MDSLKACPHLSFYGFETNSTCLPTYSVWGNVWVIINFTYEIKKIMLIMEIIKQGKDNLMIP